MEKIAIISCGAYIDTSYGCPGDWRCLKAAALGEGKFKKPVQVISFIKCKCPGRATLANIKLFIKMAEIQPELIYFSSCMITAKPECKNMSIEKKIAIIKEKTNLSVIQGTHEYY